MVCSGDVDILINNAGVVSGRFVEEISDDAIKRTFGVNTLALFWTTRAFLPGVSFAARRPVPHPHLL